MIDVYRIIKEPIISEKSTDLNNNLNQVVFKVDRTANKHQIKTAIEAIYQKKGIIVTSVKTMTMPGKPKRVRNRVGRTSSWKKAIVTLKEGCKLEFH